MLSATWEQHPIIRANNVQMLEYFDSQDLQWKSRQLNTCSGSCKEDLLSRSRLNLFHLGGLVTTMKVARRHGGGLLCLQGIIKRSKIQGDCPLRVPTRESRVKSYKRGDQLYIMFYLNFFCIPFWQTFERRSTLYMVDKTKTTHICIFYV